MTRRKNNAGSNGNTWDTVRHTVRFTGALLLVWLSAWAAWAQADRCMLHVDKSFYVTGEIIWYKLYLPAVFIGHPVAIRVVTTAADAQTVDEYFLHTLGDNYVSGFYRIPNDQRGGLCGLHFLAGQRSSGHEFLLGSFSIPVYSDLLPPGEIETQAIIPSGPLPYTPTAALQISFVPDAAMGTTKPAISGKIIVADENGQAVRGHASLSVRDQHLASSVTYPSDLILGPGLPPNLSVATLSPQSYVKGKVTDYKGEALQANVLGAYSEASQRFYFTKSDEDGAFFLPLPEFQGMRTIQFIGYDKENPNMLTKLEAPAVQTEPYPLSYTPEIQEYLRLSQLRRKVNQYFDREDLQIPMTNTTTDRQTLSPQASYEIKQYESFKDLSSFFGELITPLRFRLQSDSTYMAAVFNSKADRRSTGYLSGRPIFIVDDKITRNADFVARLPIGMIEKVELFSEPRALQRQFQVLGSSGVVKLYTTVTELQLPYPENQNIHTVFGYQADLRHADLFPASSNTSSLAPYFQPQLYWDGQGTLDDNGEFSWSFRQVDATEMVEITVVVETTDGRRQMQRFSYQIPF